MHIRLRHFYLAVFALLESVSAHDSSPNGHSALGGPSHETCAIDPRATVSDACASFSTLARLNKILQPSIKGLTQSSDFFSYYRLNLYNKECPFWDDGNGSCGNRACAVDTIENEEDVPLIWRAEELGKLEGPKARHPDRKLQREEKPLMGELGGTVGESCVVEYDDECDDRDYCVPEDESATGKGDYVSLVDNPERFTGYSGSSAHQVWEAIYNENCFSRDSALSASTDLLESQANGQAAKDLGYVISQNEGLEDEQCLEKRVFYRIISGMHASISTHLCYDYLNQTTGQWGPNQQCHKERLHDHPDRISNLYFNYALLLRAVVKARPAFESYTFCSGDPSQDQFTKQKVLQLANEIAAGPKIYDEGLMFSETNGEAQVLKEDFKVRFRNVSRTMDCVGCDKCRLWGKLQTAGYGAALKVLFEFDDANPADNPPLRRTELVALVNTLDKVSSALSALEKFEEMIGHNVPSDESAIYEMINDMGDVPEGYYYEEKPEPKPKSALRQSFETEFGHVFRTLIWVLKSWIALPGEILTLVWTQFKVFVDVWLGKSVTTGADVYHLTGWEKRQPPKHPAKRNEL